MTKEAVALQATRRALKLSKIKFKVKIRRKKVLMTLHLYLRRSIL
jgi:hypothetical protein